MNPKKALGSWIAFVVVLCTGCANCPEDPKKNDLEATIVEVDSYGVAPDKSSSSGGASAITSHSLEAVAYLAAAGAGVMPSAVLVCGYGKDPTSITYEWLAEKDGQTLRTRTTTYTSVQKYSDCDCWEAEISYPGYIYMGTAPAPPRPWYDGATPVGVFIGVSGESTVAKLSDYGPVWITYSP